MKKWTKKTKRTVVLGMLVIALVGGGSAYAYSSQSKQQLEAAQTQVMDQEAALKNLNSDLKGYFDKKSPSYLVENMQESQIKDFKKDVEKATSLKETTAKVDHSTFDKEVEAINETMKKIEKTFELQQATNKLFQGTAVNGAKISKDLPIADDLKQETIDQVKKSMEKTTSDFEKTIQSLTTEAENQLKQLDKAKQATAKVYKDKVISTDTKLYDTAKIEVDKIKNAKGKKTLMDQLSKVKADIDKKASEEAKEQSEVKQENGVIQQKPKTPEAPQVSVQTDQRYTPDYTETGGAADTGDYVPQEGNGNSQPQVPVTQEQTPPATGGGQTVPPAKESEQPTVPNYPTGEQEGNSNWGGSWTGGWEDVK
ncbi:hypothetical protein [Candidatus Enterococcus mansonii]|uniref:Uncharacterized protein n=1 Tax=Candidatus Enterococcus mansonii TaxID=1834181 RepID=A0A2C9XGG5_9ENTE|nr:hypothetical protein [Enterococcus sp. 4G2_DIV0659]OTO02771.1 hypothetical protein A5880_003167 [Enterococcus sp. 4G2_DIV0659]